ncbi:hypothetical protein [Rheinheimera soli]|uniref:Uncharacterized protein n=1 Tax=Rheinheimera soli TaxID=443616 RepID=A0ABU1W3K3_9GAMM|nr:hypothetical protein [Rheinheimera soli]MDR7122569.1 hypothetical protein [Rheinheimera soli]
MTILHQIVVVNGFITFIVFIDFSLLPCYCAAKDVVTGYLLICCIAIACF